MRRPIIFALAVASFAAPAPVTAQPQREQGPAPGSGADELVALRRQVEARIDSIVPLYRAAIDARDSAKRAQRESDHAARTVPLDTLAAGPFLIVGPAGAPQAVRARFLEAWRTLEDLTRGAHVPHLEGTVFLVEYGRNSSPLSDLASRPQHVRLWFPHWRGPNWHRAMAQSAILNALSRDLPPDVQAWLMSRGLGEMTGADHVFRLLSLSPDPAARECVAGSDAACVAHLALLAGPAPPEEYAAVRPLLLRHALRLGGPGALARLAGAEPTSHEAGEAMRPWLEAAAGAPMEAVVSGWLQEVRAARPDAWAGLGRSQGTTLLWVLLFMALATRSTRWRIG
jgi:hypothetical protein